MLYGSVASLPSPSSNIEAWPYGTSLRFAPAFRALGVCEHLTTLKKFRSELFLSHSNFLYVDLRTNSDFRSRSFDLLPPTQVCPGSIEFFFSSIRSHGSSSSIKCHVYHHVGGRRHTPVVCNESREPHTSHYTSRPVTIKTNYSNQPLCSRHGPLKCVCMISFLNFFLSLIGFFCLPPGLGTHDE